MTACPFNLSDVLAELETHPGRWKKGPRMEMFRALKRLPKKLNMSLEDLPANEIELAAIIDAKMHWMRDGFNCERSFQNFRARVLRSVRETHPGTMPCFTRHHRYSPAWRPLVDDIDAAIARGDENGRVWRGLSHLTGYANWRGLSPEEVDSALLAELVAVHAETKRVVRTHGGRPRKFARKAIEAAQAWNKLVREKNQKPWLRHLPATILEWEGQRKRLNLPFSAFPKSFQDEVDSYLRFMKMTPEPRPAQEAADPILDEFGHIRDSVPETEQPPLPDIVFKKRKRRPAKPKTVKTRQWAILQTANALIRYGEMKLEEIRSLRDITSLRALKISLSDFRSRHEAAGRFDKTAASRFHLASYLIQIARFAGWHAAHIGEMEKLRDISGAAMGSRRSNTGSGGAFPPITRWPLPPTPASDARSPERCRVASGARRHDAAAGRTCRSPAGACPTPERRQLTVNRCGVHEWNRHRLVVPASLPVEFAISVAPHLDQSSRRRHIPEQ